MFEAFTGALNKLPHIYPMKVAILYILIPIRQARILIIIFFGKITFLETIGWV